MHEVFFWRNSVDSFLQCLILCCTISEDDWRIRREIFFCIYSLFIYSRIVHLFRQLDTMNNFFYWWFLSRVLVSFSISIFIISCAFGLFLHFPCLFTIIYDSIRSVYIAWQLCNHTQTQTIILNQSNCGVYSSFFRCIYLI